MAENTDQRIARSAGAAAVRPRAAAAETEPHVASPVRGVAGRSAAPKGGAATIDGLPTAPRAMRRAGPPATAEQRSGSRPRALNLPMVLRIDDRDMAAVCVTSGSAGGQIRCQEQLPIGARLALTARASGTTLAEVCLATCVAGSTVDRARGSATLEVDWLSATSAGGTRVLHSFLTSKVRLAVEIAAISSIGGFAVYRFAVRQSGKGPPLRGDSEVLRARHMARVISFGGASAPGAIQVQLPLRLGTEGTKAPASEDTEPASPRALWRMGHSAPWPDHVPETMANRYTGLRFLGSGGKIVKIVGTH